MNTNTHAPRRGVHAALIGFAVIFLAMMGLAVAKKMGALDYGLAKRGFAMLLGVMVMGAGNFVPKFRLFDAPGRDPRRVQAAERLAGWTFVLAGAAYIAVWALVPLGQVMLVSSFLSFAAFGLVALAWRRAATSKGASPDTPLSKVSITGRILLATILATFLWAAATFFIDHLWGDEVTKWMAIVYPLLIGVPLGVYMPAALAKRGTAA